MQPQGIAFGGDNVVVAGVSMPVFVMRMRSVDVIVSTPCAFVSVIKIRWLCNRRVMRDRLIGSE